MLMKYQKKDAWTKNIWERNKKHTLNTRYTHRPKKKSSFGLLIVKPLPLYTYIYMWPFHFIGILSFFILCFG